MNIELFKPLMEEKWVNRLEEYLVSDSMEDTLYSIKKDKKDSNVFPFFNEWFNAFKYCPWDKVKVVILDQEPYFNKNLANGLAFSTKNEKLTPSLDNIFKEVKRSIHGDYPYDRSTNLKDWAEQGVLLLNTSLTIKEGLPGSHLEKWNRFIKYVLFTLSAYKTGVVYMLWGDHAMKYQHIMGDSNHILTAVHPSHRLAHKGFIGCNHFTTANKLITKMNGAENIIKW